MRFIGIDPGLDGAIAILDEVMIVNIVDMPTITVTSKSRKTRDYNIPAIVHSLNGGSPSAPMSHCIIERQQAMPPHLKGQRQGVTSSFRVGLGYGILLGVLSSLEIPYTVMSSAVWKRAVGVSRDKGESRLVATRLFPAARDALSRVKDDGRAEALLLAWYARRMHAMGES